MSRKTFRFYGIVCACILLSLQGCSLSMFQDMIQGQGPRTYDPVEYDYLVRMASNSTHAVHRCDDTKGAEFQKYAQLLNADSMQFVEFVSNKDGSELLQPQAQQIRTMVNQFLRHADGSLKYCVHKVSNIQASTRMLGRSLGGYDQKNACFGDVKSRYTLFEDSFNASAITKSEFTELSNDLLKLQDIDASGCTVKSKQDLLQTLNFIRQAVSVISAL